MGFPLDLIKGLGGGSGIGDLASGFFGGGSTKQTVTSNLSSQLGVSIQNVVGRGRTGDIDTPQNQQPVASTVPENSFANPVLGAGFVADPIGLKNKLDGTTSILPYLAIGAAGVVIFMFAKGK